MDSIDVKEFIISIGTQYWHSVLILFLILRICCHQLKINFQHIFWGVGPYGGDNMKTERYEIELVQEAKILSLMMEELDVLDAPIMLKELAAKEVKLHGSTCVEYGMVTKKQQFEILGLELLVDVGNYLKSYYDPEYQQAHLILIELYKDRGDEVKLCKVYTNWAKIFLNEYDIGAPEIREQTQIYLDEAHRLAKNQEIAFDGKKQPEWYDDLYKTTSQFEEIKFQFENI